MAYILWWNQTIKEYPLEEKIIRIAKLNNDTNYFINRNKKYRRICAIFDNKNTKRRTSNSQSWDEEMGYEHWEIWGNS